MVYKFIILSALILCGCGSLLEKKESLKAKSTLTESTKSVSDSHIDAMFPSPSSVVVTASGNSSPQVNVTPHKEMTKFKQGEKKTADESAEQTFSIDSMLSSVPTWLYVVLGFLKIFGVLLFIYILKATMLGKAFDSATASALNMASSVMDMGRQKLIKLDPESSEYKAIKDFLDDIEKKSLMLS